MAEREQRAEGSCANDMSEYPLTASVTADRMNGWMTHTMADGLTV